MVDIAVYGLSSSQPPCNGLNDIVDIGLIR